MSEEIHRRLRFLRFGLLVVPPLAFAIYMAYMFPFVGLGKAILPALLWGVLAGILCVVVYYAYKWVLTRQK